MTSHGRRDEARLLSVNVSRPKPVQYRGKTVQTGIFKEPIAGPVMVRTLNIDGDQQADLTVHGGRDKAVYLYPAESYALWEDDLARDLPYGHFGENLTITGLLEESVRVDDLIEVGEVLLQVTEPRFPCFKLGIKMGRQTFLKQFLRSGRSGFYCRVLREGVIEAGNAITHTPGNDPAQPTIAQLVAVRIKTEPS